MTYLGGYGSTEMDRLNEYLSISTANSQKIHDFGKLLDGIIRYESALLFCVIFFFALLAILFAVALIISWFEDRRIYYDYVFDWYIIRRRERLGIVGILEIEEDIEWLKKQEALRRAREKEEKEKQLKAPKKDNGYSEYSNYSKGYTGYDPYSGYSQSGYSQSGYSQSGYSQSGYSQSGYSKSGYSGYSTNPKEREMQQIEAEHDAARAKADAAEAKWQKIQEAERKRKREEEDKRVRELEEKIDAEWMGRDDVDEREAGLFYKGLRKHSVSTPNFAVADEVIMPPRSISIAKFSDHDPENVRNDKLYGGAGGAGTSRSGGGYSSISAFDASATDMSNATSRISNTRYGMTARTASGASKIQQAQADRQSMLSNRNRSSYDPSAITGYSMAPNSSYSNAPSSSMSGLSSMSNASGYSDASGYSSASNPSGYSNASGYSTATKGTKATKSTKTTKNTKSSKAKKGSSNSDSDMSYSDDGSEASYDSSVSKGSKSKRSTSSKRSSAGKSKKSSVSKSKK